MKICSFYTLLHVTRISHRKNSVIQISPRVNDWGLIRTGDLFQNLGLHGGLFEYGGLIGTGGLNEDLRYWYSDQKIFMTVKKYLWRWKNIYDGEKYFWRWKSSVFDLISCAVHLN